MNATPPSTQMAAMPCGETCAIRFPAAASAVQRATMLAPWLALSLVLGFTVLAGQGWRQLALYAVGLAMGAVLLRTGFGFSGAFRRLLMEGDTSALRAPLALIGVTTLLFAPWLAAGEAFGQAVGAAAAPVGVQVAVGAFLFGAGMQLGGGCGSGTLFSLGGGNGRMLVVLLFFCAASFFASLHMDWWAALPAAEAVVLGDRMGWAPAAALQVTLIGAVWWALGRRRGAPSPLRLSGAPSPTPESAAPLPRHEPGAPFPGVESGVALPLRPARAPGRWPLWVAVAGLGVLNLATLLLAGHPWTITWAFTLWGAKGAAALGWDPATSAFWQAPFQAAALAGGVLDDITSLMDIAVALGAAGAALAAGQWQVRLDRRPGALLSAVLAGLLMGYGARIAYGCTIGALVSGAASTSLHGWLWFAAALPGAWLGARLRPRFGLAG